MQVEQTSLEGVLVITPTVYEDERGYFYESYNRKELKKAGIDITFVQDNESYSKYGVLRGLHYQKEPYAQTKLVRVIAGKIFDIAVDIRKGSPTYGKWFGIELSSENKSQLLIPRGFAHGFVVTGNEAIVAYKCDEFYNKEYEAGVIFNDRDLKIDWPISDGELIVTNKDRILPSLRDAGSNFKYRK